jgi:hypothetical protein
MGEPERWQQRVEEFVLEQVGDPPARVLEVGYGEGELARALARAGHLVTAIDPRAPEGPIFRRVRLEELSNPGPFDTSEADESAAIEAGAINATRFLYVGTLALEEERFQARHREPHRKP